MAFDPDAYLAARSAPATPFDPDAYLANEKPATISRAEADKLYGEAAAFQPRPSGAFPAIERRLPTAAVAAATRTQIGEEFNETTGAWEPTYAPDGEATGPIRDAVQRLKRGAIAGTGQIIQGAGGFIDTQPVEAMERNRLLGVDGRDRVTRAVQDFGGGVEEIGLDVGGINRARDNTLLARGADTAAPLIPILASGGYGAIPASSFMMGEQGAREAEARGEDAAGVRRSRNLNTVGGALLGSVNIPGLSTANKYISRAIPNEIERRAARTILGAASGGAVNAAGDVALQLADTGEISRDRTLANLAIGGAAGAAVGGAMRSVDAPAPRPRATRELLPTLDLETARNQYNQAIELETADALRRNLELQDQRTIDGRIADQIANRELGRPAFEPTLEGIPATRASRQIELEDAFTQTPARSAEESATVFADAPPAGRAEQSAAAIEAELANQEALLRSPEGRALLAQQLANESVAARVAPIADDATLSREAALVDAEMAPVVSENIQMSPQAQRAADEFEGQFSGSRSRQFRNRSQGSVDTSVLRTLGGGIGGSAYGYATGDTPEERLARAATFGIGGAAVAGAGPAAIRRIASAAGDSGRPRRTSGLELESRPLVNADRVAVLAPVYQDVVARNPDVAAGLNGNNIPVEIRNPDGSITTGVMNGWAEASARDFGGNPGEMILRPNIGRNVSAAGGFSHTPLPAGLEIITPIPDYAEWQKRAPATPSLAGRRDAAISDGSGVETPYEAKMLEDWNKSIALEQAEAPEAGNAGGGEPPADDAATAAAGGSRFPRNTTVPRTLKEAGMDSIGLELKTKLYDYTAPEETLARNFEKEFGYEVPPAQKLPYLNSRVINSRSIADAYLNSSGYKQLIRDIPDLKAWDQHQIDLHSLDIAKNEGITEGKTIDGIDVQEAQARVDANGEAMAPFVARLRPISEDILSKTVQYGMISPQTAQVLHQMYPNYVPMEKIFDEAEKGGLNMNTNNRTAVASLSRQSVVRRRDGTASTREIKSPTASFLNKIDTLFLQGAKNEAAKALADSRNLPGWSGILQEVANDNNAPHTFTYLDNGFKRTVAAPKEIVEAVKALNRQQLGLLGRVIGFPMRVFKLGVTGADPVFAGRNTTRDQATGFIASSNPAAFAANFPRAVAEAVGHGEIYQRLLAEGGVNTSFTLARDNPQASVDQIRAGRSVKDKALYTASSLPEFIRTVEDTIGRSEQATRIQTYMTEYDVALKQGFTPKDASAKAAEAARQQLSDFSRHGDYGPIMRAFQPYLTAAFAGNRALLRNFRRAPARTTAMTAATLGVPVLAATAWAMIAQNRKEAWDDIAEYEKDNNLIFVPENPVKDENGRWNVIKIPLPQGYSKMARAMRRSYEAWQGGDPTSFAEMAQTGLGMVSPIEPTAQGIASNVLAQPVKPIAEIMLNKNSFTGRDIVTDDLMRYDPERQYNKRTSGTAIQIGKALKVSPLYVEHAIKGYTGTLGSYALNAADRLQSTVNPDIQIGGRSVSDQADRGFGSAQGGEVARRFYTLNKEASRARATHKKLLEESTDAEAETYYKENETLIDMARFLEKTARRNGIDPDLKGEDLAERLRERDERMKEALRRVEERQAEAVSPVKKR